MYNNALTYYSNIDRNGAALPPPGHVRALAALPGPGTHAGPAPELRLAVRAVRDGAAPGPAPGPPLTPWARPPPSDLQPVAVVVQRRRRPQLG